MIQFDKYQGTGNDFVLIDDRTNEIELNTSQISHLCNRRFGIGADGLMLLRLKDGFDFEMIYFNADGNESTMCGNGGRCIVAFAKKLGIIDKTANFMAIDGAHQADILDDGLVSLGMVNVSEVSKVNDDFVLFTGSPHYVQFRNEDVETLSDFATSAQKIRNNQTYAAEGINVNYVSTLGASEISMRTFERGVEAETFSCGTGAVAAAIANHKNQAFIKGLSETEISTPGGNLKVSFLANENYTNIKLIGPATHVFTGEIDI